VRSDATPIQYSVTRAAGVWNAVLLFNPKFIMHMSRIQFVMS